jgi:hypothetical protein
MEIYRDNKEAAEEPISPFSNYHVLAWLQLAFLDLPII